MISNRDLEIYEMYKDSQNKTAVGKSFDVSPRTVGRVVAKVEASLSTYDDIKVGDKIRFVEDGSITLKVIKKEDGELQVRDDVYDYTGTVYGYTDNACDTDFIGNFEIVAEAEERATTINDFDIGDEVVVDIDCPSSLCIFSAGDTGFVSKIDQNDNSVRVDFQDNSIWWFFEDYSEKYLESISHLKIVSKLEENPEIVKEGTINSFKVGDKVEVDIDCIENNFFKKGDVGTVYDLDYRDKSVNIDFEENGSWWFFEDYSEDYKENINHLKIVSKFKEESEDPIIEDNAHYVFVLTQSSIAITRVDGEDVSLRVCDKTHNLFDEIKGKLRESQHQAMIAECFDLIDIPTMLEKFTIGRIEVDVDKGTILWKSPETGRVRDVPDDIADNILYTIDTQGMEGAESTVKFLDKLMENPSDDSINDLYGFIKGNELKINEDGDVIAWKGVRSDMYDKHSGTNLHVIGEEIRVKRSSVDPDSSNPCSFGLHIGSLAYATGWGDATLEVAINPADVVSCPYRSDFHKLRVCAYTPIKRID